MFCTVDVPLFCRDWNRTAVTFSPKMLPEFATNSSTGTSTVLALEVTRIDPSVQNGTRTVDVALNGDLPPGAVPDLSVDGTIDLERITSVLFAGRPTYGQEKSTIGMFKLEGDGKTATRVQVTLGRSSVNTVEILGGLNDGDQVILSDMSRWDQYDRIRLD